jgi:ribosomal protein S18 acetylase RimI-like enzyme
MEAELRVRRIHRRDLNRVWEFLKLVFRDVNRETVEYQRPRTKKRFLEVYEEEGVEQLVFEFAHGAHVDIVGYAECTFEISGSSDNWMNHRYFERREMRPLFVEELAVHPEHQGKGIGRFMLEQLEHLAKLRGCTHLVLEVAENNQNALAFYKKRSFQKLDAAIFMAKRVSVEPELLPPRKLAAAPRSTRDVGAAGATAKGRASARAKGAPKAKAPAKTGATSEGRRAPTRAATPKRGAQKKPAAGEV